jgi:transcriptional regulator with XRE-family HTH domain
MPNPLHEPNYTTFRTMLIEAREKAGLTQVDVAGRLGKPQSYVSKYERGERRLDFVEFVLLAEILDLQPADFFSDFMNRRRNSALP